MDGFTHLRRSFSCTARRHIGGNTLHCARFVYRSSQVQIFWQIEHIYVIPHLSTKGTREDVPKEVSRNVEELLCSRGWTLWVDAGLFWSGWTSLASGIPSCRFGRRRTSSSNERFIASSPRTSLQSSGKVSSAERDHPFAYAMNQSFIVWKAALNKISFSRWPTLIYTGRSNSNDA